MKEKISDEREKRRAGIDYWLDTKKVPSKRASEERDFNSLKADQWASFSRYNGLQMLGYLSEQKQ